MHRYQVLLNSAKQIDHLPGNHLQINEILSLFTNSGVDFFIQIAAALVYMEKFKEIGI